MNTAANALTLDHEPVAITPRKNADAPAPMSPADLVAYAIQSGQPIEIIREAIALSKELRQAQALEAFDAAVADAKAEISPAIKNRTGNNSKRYADFAAYAAVVDPIIGKHGLSYRFRTTQDDRIHVTCVLSHRAGHREETTLAGPSDTTGSKNAIQAIGSTLTYLQRYTLVQALGLAASEDDDGRASDGDSGPITEEQAGFIRKLADDNGRDLAGFCKYFKIDAVPELLAKDFGRAVTALSKKKDHPNG